MCVHALRAAALKRKGAANRRNGNNLTGNCPKPPRIAPSARGLSLEEQCALADRQPRCSSATIEPMKEPLQQIDPDYYRFVQLLIAQAELEQLGQWRVDVKRRSKIPLGMSRASDRSRNLVAHSISSKRHPTSRRLPARDDLLQRHTRDMITIDARRGLSGAS